MEYEKYDDARDLLEPAIDLVLQVRTERDAEVQETS